MNRWRNAVRNISRIVLAIALMLMPWGTLSSSVPTPPSCAWFLHVSALAGLTVLVFLSFVTTRVRAWAVILIFLYSALLEFLQHFNPDRYGSIEDLAANALGCVAGLLVSAFFLHVHQAIMNSRKICTVKSTDEHKSR